MAKKARKKGGRRAYLKKFSAEATYGNRTYPKQGWSQEYHERVQSIVHVDVKKVDGVEVRTVKDQPLPASFVNTEPHDKVRVLYQSLRMQKVHEFHRIVLFKTNHYREEIWFQGRTFILIEVDIRAELIKRSIEYPSKDALMSARAYKKVAWVSIKENPLPSKAASPPQTEHW